MRYGGWFRVACALPGKWSDLLTGPRPLLPQSPLSPKQAENLARKSPRANGYLALEPEVHSFGDQNGWLGYGALNHVLLGVGGVHGETHTDTLKQWKEAATQNGYQRLMLFPVAAHERRGLWDAGFRTLHVGSEAFIDLDRFSLDGPRMRNLRQTCRRATRDGDLRVEEYTQETARNELQNVYQSWLDSRIRSFRMRLLVGGPGFHTKDTRRFFVCKSAGVPVAFVTVTPGWNGKGWGLDMMARDPNAPPGAMEFLIMETALRFRNEGAHVLSLGACPMFLTRPRDPGESRFLRWIFGLLYEGFFGGRLFRFKELARFKDKFHPRWEPIYFGGWPNMKLWTLYHGCRMWGLFDNPTLTEGNRKHEEDSTHSSHE